MTRTLSISEVKMRLTELTTGVEKRGEEIVLTRRGRPAAVLVSVAEFEGLEETIRILSDRFAVGQIQKSLRYFARGGRGLTVEKVFGEKRSVA